MCVLNHSETSPLCRPVTWFMAVAEMARLVSPRKRMLRASSSEATRCMERLRRWEFPSSSSNSVTRGSDAVAGVKGRATGWSVQEALRRVRFDMHALTAAAALVLGRRGGEGAVQQVVAHLVVHFQVGRVDLQRGADDCLDSKIHTRVRALPVPRALTWY